jgi:tetratricopeptide (TPR) repeat protein
MTDDPRFDRLLAEGLAASRDQRTEAALDFFAQASALRPASGVPHFLIGSEHASAGRMDEAETAFANAVLLAPEFALARYQLGLLHFSSQRAALALVTWQPLFDLPATDPFGHFVRGFAALAQDAFAEALQHLQRGLACDAGNPAVAEDIRKVVVAVEALAARSEPAPDAVHVLLAGYSGGLH